MALSAEEKRIMHNLANKRYFAKNKEAIVEKLKPYQAEYYRKNRDSLKKKRMDWYHAHRDEILARKKARSLGQ